MGEVLALWAAHYDIKVTAVANKQLERLKTQLPHAPWSALATLKNASDQTQAMQGLAACLPFNFH